MGYVEFKPDKLSPAEDRLFLLKRLVVCCQSCLHHDKGENECESWNYCKLLGKDVYDEFFCGYGKESFA